METLIASAAAPLLGSLLFAIQFLESTNTSCGVERELLLIQYILIRLARLHPQVGSLEKALPLQLKCRLVDIMRRCQYAIEKVTTLTGYETTIMPSTTRLIPWAAKGKSDLEAELKSHQQMLHLAVDIMFLKISMNVRREVAHTTEDPERILNEIAWLKRRFPFEMGEPLDDNIILAKYLAWCSQDRYVNQQSGYRH